MATISHNPIKGTGQEQSPPCSRRLRKRKLLLFYLNFFWMIAIGAGALWFIGLYTNWFELVGGFLGLGGICAWWAFSFNLIRDKNKKRLQLAFEKKLRSPSTAIVLAGMTAGLICLAVNVRCIIIDASRDTTDRAIRVWDENQKVVREGLLSSRGKLTIPFFLFAAKKDYVVDVEGLPNHAVSVSRLQRYLLRTPQDCLLKNVILVRPSVQLCGTAQNEENRYTMVLRYRGLQSQPIEFTGHSIWLGTQKQLEIPQSFKDKWRLEITGDQKSAVILLHWLTPELCPMASVKAFDADEPITVLIRKEDGTLYCGKTEMVKDCDHPDKFPQILLLDHTDVPAKIRN